MRMKLIFANTCIYDFITPSRLTDGGCNHGRKKTQLQCGGVKGSFPGYMFRFREGQPASIDNFKQRCKLLDSAGVSKQDPAYGVKTACLPSSVVTALKAACAAPESRPDPAHCSAGATGPEQHESDDNEHLNDDAKLRVAGGYKRAYLECDSWSELLILFPALQDRHHPSNGILVKHWKSRKIFSPLNFTEEKLQFVSEMDVCACHFSPLDVKHNNRTSATGFSLKPEAELRSSEYLAIHESRPCISYQAL